MKTPTVEDQLLRAAQRNDVDLFLSTLKEHPDLDINHGDPRHHGFTCLHYTCWDGNLPLVKLLLAHPEIDVNKTTEVGSYPLYLACANGHVGVVKELLLDPRIKNINVPVKQNGGQTPLWSAARQGRTDLIKWLIASGRFLDPNVRVKKHDKHPNTSPLEVAVKLEREEAIELLQRFQADPVGIRAEIQRELGLERAQAAEVFVLAVFLADGYLRLTMEATQETNKQTVKSPVDDRGRKLRSFWRIISQLPLELQMVQVNRTFGSGRAFVRAEDSEIAFKKLGIILTRMQHTQAAATRGNPSGGGLKFPFPSSSSSSSASSASPPSATTTTHGKENDSECSMM